MDPLYETHSKWQSPGLQEAVDDAIAIANDDNYLGLPKSFVLNFRTQDCDEEPGDKFACIQFYALSDAKEWAATILMMSSYIPANKKALALSMILGTLYTDGSWHWNETGMVN